MRLTNDRVGRTEPAKISAEILTKDGIRNHLIIIIITLLMFHSKLF